MAHVLSPRVAQKDFLPLISFLSIILGSYFDFRALPFLVYISIEARSARRNLTRLFQLRTMLPMASAFHPTPLPIL